MKANFNNKNLNSFPNIPNPKSASVLTLNNNSIKNIPPQIKEFTSLQQLHVENNELEYVSNEIGELKQLSHVYLRNNQLENLPKGIADLPNLINLILDNNLIKSLPNNIGKLKKLSLIYLSGNKLSKMPDSFFDLKKLTHIRLGDNKLKNVSYKFGDFENLLHLDLSNNDLSWIPEELGKLTKLKKILLEGNSKLPVPDNHARMTPKDILSYVFEHQTPLGPDLNTKKAYLFRSISSPEMFENYKSKLNEFLLEEEIEVLEVEKLSDIDEKVTVVFIIVPFDVYKNQKLIFKILEKCEKEGIRHYILKQNTKKDAEGLINLDKGKEINSLRRIISTEYSNKIINFSTLLDLHNKIIDGLKQHTPQVLIKKLKLINIGHFDNLSLSFTEDINCVIGENGSGKSTILKAIAFGIVGYVKGVDENKMEKLLRIEKLDENTNKISFCESGSIELEYSIDGDIKKNKINFNLVDDNIEITQVGDFEIISNHYNLKSLILGYPQVRSSVQSKIYKDLPQANVNDLLPIINNVDKNRILSFENWLSNLFSEATKKVATDKKLVLEKVDEIILIKKVFRILSKITKRDISFLTIDYDASKPVIIVSTFDAKKGIPMNLVSEGFQVIFGWVGSFLERLSQAYPMTKGNFEKEKATILLDEIDTYIHPKWQMDFLNLLRLIFPKTQFITTSHSPLVVAGLNGNQIIDLDISRNRVKLAETTYDGTKYLDVGSTLLSYFNLDSILAKKLQSNIDEYYNLKSLDKNNPVEKTRLNELEIVINKSTAGSSIYDYRYLAFVKFLKKNKITQKNKIKNLALPEELEKELIAELKKYQ